MDHQHDKKIIDIGDQHRLFLLEECDLTPRFKLGLWYRAQVQTGEMWQVYRDGRFYIQLYAGPHVLWNGLWHNWKALHINLRNVLLNFAFEGRVKGPPMPREDQKSIAGVDLGCTVKARLELSCKISNIETFLQYEDPLSVFSASLKNMVIEIISSLPYDQFGEWATTLRDEIRERLQGGRNDAHRLIGMRVEEVYVTQVEPNSLQDRQMAAMYQQVEQVRRELAKAQADRERDNVKAQSIVDQAKAWNIAPSILALQDSPIGKELIARDADLRKMMVAAGLNPGVSVQPLRDPQAQLGGGPPPSAGYLNPPASSRQFSPANTGPVSGSLQYTSGQSGVLPPFSQPAASQALIDAERQEREIAALQAAGFQCAGKGQHSPTYDSAGQPIPGSTEWILEVYVQRINGFITVVFNCPAGYPAVPPRVQIRLPGVMGLKVITPNAIRAWNTQNSLLVEIVREIDDTTP